MVIRPETESFLSSVEQSTGKTFRYRNEIAVLIDLSEKSGHRQLFDDLTFYSKFVRHASRILTGVGNRNTDTVKVSAEFQDAIEKISTLLRTLVKDAEPEVRKLIVPRFVSPSADGLGLLLELCGELNWIKDYYLDLGYPQK
jgi:hypothetical protein